MWFFFCPSLTLLLIFVFSVSFSAFNPIPALSVFLRVRGLVCFCLSVLALGLWTREWMGFHVADFGAGPAAWWRSVSVSPSIHVVWTSAELMEARSQEEGTCVYYLTLPVRLQVGLRSEVRGQGSPSGYMEIGVNRSPDLHLFIYLFHSLHPFWKTPPWLWLQVLLGREHHVGVLHIINHH